MVTGGDATNATKSRKVQHQRCRELRRRARIPTRHQAHDAASLGASGRLGFRRAGLDIHCGLRRSALRSHRVAGRRGRRAVHRSGEGAPASLVEESVYHSRRGRFSSKRAHLSGERHGSTRAAASASRSRSRCRVTCRRPRANTHSSRRASRTSASACQPPCSGPSPHQSVVENPRTHLPVRPRRISIGEARITAHAAELVKDQSDARTRARDRGGGEAVGTPLAPSPPRPISSGPRWGRSFPLAGAETRDIGENLSPNPSRCYEIQGARAKITTK